MFDKLYQHSYCSYCGSKYLSDSWPRHCENCNNNVWRNPLPVAVITIYVYERDKPAGILLVRRGIDPHIGELALPGGYLELGETWQEGSVRELCEETGIDIKADSIFFSKIITSPTNGNLLIISEAFIGACSIPKFISNNEVSEIMIAYEYMELAFPIHTHIMKRFFIKE